MTNEVSIFDQGNSAQLPAHLQQYAKQAEAAAQMVTGFNSLPKISLRGKQFRYMKDDKEFVYPMGAPYNCVILAIDPPEGVAKSWYKDAYSSDNVELPDCFSADGKVPDSLSGNKQARSCAECPKNAFGSGTDAQGNPSKGKACGDHKNLFVVESDKLDDAISVIRVPATSLRNLSSYGRELARNQAPPMLVVTQMTFTDSEFPQLEFKATSFLNPTDAAKMVERSESAEVSEALPSKNMIASFDPDTGEIFDKPALPAPAKTTLEMTAKANGMSQAKFEEAGWDVGALIEHGYAVEKAVEAMPAPPAKEEIPSAPGKAEPVKTMTAKAGATTYEQFTGKGWTDEQLIDNGYMELK